MATSELNLLQQQGADIASASTIALDGINSFFNVTGTTGISTINTAGRGLGATFSLLFAGAVTLTHSSGLALRGAANYTTVPGDVLEFRVTGTNQVAQKPLANNAAPPLAAAFAPVTSLPSAASGNYGQGFLLQSPAYDALIEATSGLLGYLPLNESTGTTANDASGNGRNATYNGGFTLAEAGLVVNDPETCVELDGSTGYIHWASISSAFTPAAFSVECWINWFSNQSPGAIFILNFTSGVLEVSINSGGYFNCYFDNGSTNVQPEVGCSQSNVHHVVMTYDGTTAKMYVDAGSPATATISMPGGNAGSGDAYIGENGGGGQFLGTYIQKFAVYNRALSPTEITAHHAIGTGSTADKGYVCIQSAPSVYTMQNLF